MKHSLRKLSPTPRPGGVRRKGFLSVALVLAGPMGAVLLAPSAARAQTSGTWIGTAAGNWSVATNWLGGAIPDGGGIATFNDLTGQISGFTVTVDTSRTLGEIRFNSGYSFTIATAASQLITMGGSGLTLNAIYGLQSSPSTFFTTANTISGTIAGSGDLIKTGTSNAALSGVNTFTGTVRANQGTLWINGGTGSLGNAANGIDFNGGILGINTTTISAARAINVGAGGGTLQTFVAFTTSGAMTGSGALVKQLGNANFTYQGDGTGFSGLLRTEGGSIILSGNGRIGAGGAVEIGGTVALDSSTTNFNNRLGGRQITARGGTLTVTGNAGAATTEAAGNLTLAQGNQFVTVTPNAAQSSTLSFTGLTRQNNSTLFLRGTSLGTAPGANVATVLFTASPGTLIGGGGDPTTSTTASILPWAYGNTSASATLASTFLTWDSGTQRIIPVNVATGYATNVLTAGAQDNVNQGADAALAAPTTINALRIAPAAAINISGSPLTVTSGAILQTSAALANTISAPVTAGSQELVLISNSGSAGATGLLMTGAISGTGGVTVTGGGVVSLLGANTYTGLTSLISGTNTVGTTTATADGSAPSAFGQDISAIRMTQGGATNRLWTTGALTINRPLNVTLGSGSTIGIGTAGLSSNESVTLNGNLALSNTTPGSITTFLAFEGDNARAGGVTVNGNVSGAGGLRANFGSYVVLNGNNTYSGGTQIGGTGYVQTGSGTTAQQAGDIWEVGSNTAFGTGPVYVGSFTATGSATAQGITAPGTVVTAGGARTLSNRFILINGYMNVSGSSPLTLTGPLELNGSAANSSVLTVGATAPVTISGAVSNGSLVKSGAGALTLSGANTYTGATIVRQGVLSVGSIGNGGVFGNLSGAPSTGTYLTLSGTAVGDTGTLRYTGPGESTNRLFALSGSGGTIDASGTGALNLTNTAAATMNSLFTGITGATIFAGLAILPISSTSAGTYVVGSTISNTNFPALTTITEVGPNYLRFSNASTNTTTQTAQTINIAAPAALTARPLTLTGTSTAVNTLAPIIPNGASLNTSVVKSGVGTWSLTGANTYSGGTTINAGTLLANNATGSATGTGPVTVNSGGTLGGSGSVGGNLTVASSGTVSPGNSPGALTVNGNAAFGLGSILSMELNGNAPGTGYDQLVVNGTVDLGSSSLLLSLGFTPNINDKFFLVVNDAADGITNTFAGLPQGATVTVGGYQGTISYVGDSVTSSITGGNDAILYGLIAVPEPGSAALLALGGLPLLALLRRRKSA